MTYSDLLTRYKQKADGLTIQLRWLSILRLSLFAAFIFCGYRSLVTGHSLFIIGMLLFLAGFLVFIRIYDRMKQRLVFYKALVTLNQNEISFLQTQISVYPGGNEFIDPQHSYSYDLDLFGNGGLFPYLNRCSTSFGKEALAKDLLQPDAALISARQEAIIELRDHLEFRQHLQAHGSLLDTREKEMNQLKGWLAAPPVFRTPAIYYLMLLLPAITLGLLCYYLVSEKEAVLNLFYTSFIANLFAVFLFARKISAHLHVSTSVTSVLLQLAGQLKQIEDQSFESSLLKKLQDGLHQGRDPASRFIDRLASLFNYLETIINPIVSVLLNGLFLFHIHILFRLDGWKKKEGKRVMHWFEILGAMEALNSFANLAYNNPSFCLPVLSSEETLVAEKMGHPLIAANKRVNNTISFAQRQFVILTGSNMSGKSTFLRTLGINLVLARTGSTVCAEQFLFYPYSVQVSMRITDSLQDSESFFYAELKRLQGIIHRLQTGEKMLVILDEILRGTNSNDKHNGTMGLIRKLVQAGACGIIATHDLTVSALEQELNGRVANRCFESEIINNELVFDYRLKDGVCSHLSASFLMKKMGVIEG